MGYSAWTLLQIGVNTPRVARACGGAAAAIRPRQQCSCLRTGMASQNCKRLHRSASPRHTDAAKCACLQAGDCVLAGENGVPRNDRQACCGGPASCWPDQSCSIILSMTAENAAKDAQPRHMPFGPALCASTAPAAQPAYTLL